MKALVVIAAAAVVFFVGELAHLQLLTSLWIPIFMLLFLAGFPLFAVVGQSSLFWGLFDMNLSPRASLPVRHYVATFRGKYDRSCSAQRTGTDGHSRDFIELVAGHCLRLAG